MRFRAGLAASLWLALLAWTACSPAVADEPPKPTTTIKLPAGGGPPAADPEQVKQLLAGAKLVRERKYAEGLQFFDKVIAYYEQKFGNDRSKQYFCARSPVETLMYAADAAKDKKDAVVLSSTWADAYRLKGSTQLEQGLIADGQATLEKAVKLSPFNSIYLTELGYSYQVQKNWNKSLDVYSEAAGAAQFAPESSKTYEIGRALRGEGYALTELKRFDEAEKKYGEALRLNPNDDAAKHELEYIRSARAKSQ